MNKDPANQFTDVLPTRLTMLQRAQADPDDPAWGDLLEYYDPFIRKILLRIGLRGADLEDAHQQVRLKLWKGLTAYRRDESRGRFRNWLSALIRNAAIDWMRAQRRHREGAVSIEKVDLDLTSTQPADLDKVIETEWQHHIVQMAMERLQDVFTGNAFEVLALSMKGQNADAIASELGIRRESVYVIRNRVKTRLNREIVLLREELEGGEPSAGSD